MLERQLSYQALHAKEAPAAKRWLLRSHTAEFARQGGILDDARYLELATKVQGFGIFESAERASDALLLPLRSGPLRSLLHGKVSCSYVSAARGERRSHLESEFELPGGWLLCLHQMARQELLSGRVRLTTEFYFVPGQKLSFRFLIAAQALRWALSHSLNSSYGANHE